MGTFLKIKENYHIANGYILQYAHINTREESIKIVFSHSKLKNAEKNSKLFFLSLILILYNFVKFLSYCKLAYFPVFHNNRHIANGHTCQKYYNNGHIRKDNIF